MSLHIDKLTLCFVRGKSERKGKVEEKSGEKKKRLFGNRGVQILSVPI